MVDRRWLRLKALHERVFELPLVEARALVERELADDPELARELLSLLEQKMEGTKFLSFDDAPLEPSIFPPHHRLGDYELLHEIGRGGMGFVYMARHLPLERDVALKVLNPTLSNRPEQVDRFRREAQRLARFKHPGIVPIFDVQSIDSVHFFAMEYVDGLDLHRELVCLRKQVDPATSRSTLPPVDSKDYFRVVAGIVRQAAEALADAHDHQITHRDIKPHNLILGRDGRLRIVDFGIARDENMGRARANDEASGTLYYMSPEQARVTRSRVVDHRTDIYSLGVVLYELLTLRRPFDGATQREILKAIEVREALPVRDQNPRVPRDLAVICHTAMEKEPAERYASSRAFAADLGRFSSGEPIVAAPPSVVDHARRFGRRHRLALSMGLLALIAAMAGFNLRKPVLAASTPTRLSFRFSNRAVEASPIRLSYQSFDPVLEKLGPRVEIGSDPLARPALPAGFVRLLVEYSTGESAELGRLVRPGTPDTIVEIPPPSPGASSNEGMVRIEGGVLSRRQDPTRTQCSNLDLDIAVAPFWIETHEVTVREYREFLRASGRPPPERWALFGEDPLYDNRPVVGLSRLDMQAYAEFHGKRLPTHAEWELAARGVSDRRTPTGAPISAATRAAIHGEGPRITMDFTERLALWKQHVRDVGTSPDDVTPEGVFDMLGNVREATESAFVNVQAEGGVPQVIPDCYWLLGEAWFSDAVPCALDAHAFGGTATLGSVENGFRCARSIAQ